MKMCKTLAESYRVVNAILLEMRFGERDVLARRRQ